MIRCYFYKIVLILLLFSFSLLLSLGTSELILRKIYKKKYQNSPWQTSGKALLDKRLIYILKPNWYSEWSTHEFTEKTTIQNFGFRNLYDISKEKPTDVYRIIITGDSFTYGHGLENKDTYPAVLEKLLNENYSNEGKIKKRFEVLNAAVPGYSPDQEYRQITERLLDFSPDVIIWNSTYNNDIYDLIETVPALYDIKAGKIVALDARFNWLYLQNFLFLHTPAWIKNTHLFDLAASSLSGIKSLRRTRNLSRGKLLEWAEGKLFLEITSVNKISKEKKINFVLVILPVKEAFGKNTDSESRLFEEVQENLSKKLKDNGVLVYDLKKELEKRRVENTGNNNRSQVLGIEAYNPELLFFRKDTHPNKLGAQTFAGFISEYLAQSLSLRKNE